MKRHIGLFLKAVFTLCACAFLLSCGGGGGSSSVAAGSVSTYAVSGTVTLNGSGLSGVTVSLTGAATGSTTTDANGNYTFSSLQNGSYTVTPTLNGYSFSPSNTAVTVNSENFTGQNFTGTPVVLHYTDKVYAIWGLAGDVFAVTKDGATQVVNATQYQTGAYPLGNCGLGPKLATGQVLVSCQAASTGATQHTFYVDPTEAMPTIRDYSGEIPSDTPVYPNGGYPSIFDFVDGTYNPQYPDYVTEAKTADGLFFAPSSDDFSIYFTNGAGVTTIVAAGTFSGNGNVAVLKSYSN